jgi:hypothetical protein
MLEVVDSMTQTVEARAPALKANRDGIMPGGRGLHL